jgi:3-methyladenine DNA glycosylase AlkD
MPKPFRSTLEAELAAAADSKSKASFEKYFKGVTLFYGVRAPALKLLFKTLWPTIRDRDVEANVADAFELLESKYMEERQVAIMILEKSKKKLPDDLLARLEPIFDRTVHDWATCDGICGQVLRPLLVRSERDRRRIAGWSKSKNFWVQRASAVAFVNEARHGEHDDRIIEICERVVKSPERFAQLGAGWVLRELALHDEPRVLAFLRAHYASISREGLRYAIEKMKKPLQTKLLEEHAAISAREATSARAKRRAPARSTS